MSEPTEPPVAPDRRLKQEAVAGHDAVESTGEQEQRWVAAIGRGVSHCIETVRDRYERSPNPEDRMPFHNAEHTLDVMRRTKEILGAIDSTTPREQALAELAAAGHDLVRNWQEKRTERGGTTIVTRGRQDDKDEANSAAEVVEYLRAVNAESDVAFSRDDEGLVAEAIVATVPGFDRARQVMIQPNLTERSHRVAWALAMADIGTAGMDGPEAYAREGNQRFQELNLDVTRLVDQGVRLDGTAEEALRQRILDWTEEQVKFARDRRTLFDNDHHLATLPAAAQHNVRILFRHFNETITGIETLQKERQAMSLPELLASLEYQQTPETSSPSDGTGYERPSHNATHIIAPRLRMVAEQLRREGVSLEPDEPLPPAGFAQLLNEAKIEVTQGDRTVEGRPNPYHNVEHAQEVLDRVQVLLASDSTIRPEEVQVVQLAALFHDFGHSGQTKRESTDGLSNEELAALHADHFAQARGLSIRQRRVLQGLIIGTTFGDPTIKPKTKLEKLLALADVGGFVAPWKEWVAESARVLEETPLANRPTTVEQWLAGRGKFLTWIEQSRLVPGMPNTWLVAFRDKQLNVAAALDGTDPAARTVVESLITPLLPPLLG